jgi:phosphoenolpyruvate carboxykinase (ATP)
MLDLSHVGISTAASIYRNLPTAILVEHAIRGGEGLLAHMGPLVVSTGKYTGRSAKDKFIIEEPTTKDEIWWGEINQPFREEDYLELKAGLQSYLQERDVYVQDCYAGADPEYRVKLRIITEQAWQSLLAHNMFLRENDPDRLAAFEPDFTVISCPNYHADPKVHHTNSEAFILLNLAEHLVLIGGSSYGGEIKKSVFTIMNYLLPHRGVLPMHSSANVGPRGRTAVYFGLSGTGKTTLSTVGDRALVGDDEHGWSSNGIFNFEGGCYAKVIRLSAESEPEIYQTTRRFGTILENVTIDPETRNIDLNEARTENTRSSYPITHLDNVQPDGRAGHPVAIIMLAADAFGVLPPISRLSPEQAQYHFISGYTAKVAGTERGIDEPQATFSACFGAPFMPLHPAVYADLLGSLIAEHKVSTWLVNTGWTGGPYGVGERFNIAFSRAAVAAAVDGTIDDVEYRTDPVFGFKVPTECPGIPSEVLDPKSTWDDPDAYDAAARDLARRFAENFEEFADRASPEVAAAGPSVD